MKNSAMGDILQKMSVHDQMQLIHNITDNWHLAKQMKIVPRLNIKSR